ncbi:TlpA disulfide reductase family protein [Deinococcus sp. YIM 77859]|uniref:TlpA family protein disulfide reductase n=1 Tax=Deinococcus sp. YIM 77859 TaxID=1540221 RepID=UPI000553B77B|nr:TlpA disulfide reductase family protein [Deinococcus sp. YIM 77859]
MKRVLVLLALVSLATPLPAYAGGGAGALRRPAPNFTFTDLGGERVSLAELRGQAVIVQFGDVGCAVCRENDRLLRHYQLEYVTHGLVVVSLHGQATLDELRRYDAAFTFSTLTGLDPGQAIARRYHALPVPTTVFIDRDGFIRDVRRGRLDEDELLRSLQGLL